MRFLYNTGICLMRAAAAAAALFNTKIRLRNRGCREVFRALRSFVKEGDRVVWFHCSSLGEFEQGRPVIEAIRGKFPGHKIVLTFFSASGYEIRKNYEVVDQVLYLPYDTPSNARRFVALARPEIAVFVKYEYWYNFLRALHRSGCRTYIVSAIFFPKQVFFRWYGGFFRKMLRFFHTIFVQDAHSEKLLRGLGVSSVIVAGDTRFDRVASIAAAVKPLPAVEAFAAGAEVLIAGSTWEKDEELLLPLVNDAAGMKFIIVPHEISESRIEKLMEAIARPAVRYTAIDGDTELSRCQVLVIDTVGILSSAYSYCRYAYIGGGFGAGIHNTLEAATFGLPLAFGPNYQQFKEARDLVAVGAARPVGRYDELAEWLFALAADRGRYSLAGEASHDYVATHRGATGIIVDAL